MREACRRRQLLLQKLRCENTIRIKLCLCRRVLCTVQKNAYADACGQGKSLCCCMDCCGRLAGDYSLADDKRIVIDRKPYRNTSCMGWVAYVGTCFIQCVRCVLFFQTCEACFGTQTGDCMGIRQNAGNKHRVYCFECNLRSGNRRSRSSI